MVYSRRTYRLILPVKKRSVWAFRRRRKRNGCSVCKFAPEIPIFVLGFQFYY